MQVTKIQNTTYKPVFHSWEREVKDPITKELKHRNDTYFYRDGSKYWNDLTNFIVDKYANANKVNVYSYGCSNGSEPYTFVMQMLTKYPDEAKKFLPVIAKDYDELAIKMAKSGLLPIDINDLIEIDNATGRPITDFGDFLPDKIDPSNALAYKGYYFTRDDCNHDTDLSMIRSKNKMLRLKPEFAKNVDFGIANVLKDYRKINPENSIVFARNFWPYLENYQIDQLITNLGRRLKEGSLLILGNYDAHICEVYKGLDIEKLFNYANFKRTVIPNVFEKVKGVRI